MEINHYADGHFKKHGIAVMIENGTADVPVPADIDQKTQDHKSIAQHGGQQGRPNDGMILIPVEHIGNSTGGKSPCSQGHAGCDIDTDPDTPGILIVKI